MNLLPAIILFTSNGQGTFWALAGAGGGVYLFFRGFRTLQRKRLIQNTPSSKIRSASIGLVEVSGLAVGPHTIQAPVTQAPCYYYRTIAWQMQQSGKNDKWVKVAEESLHIPFFLDDNTGRVLVDPQGAEMDIHRDFHEEFGSSLFSTRLEMPANVFSFLGRHGVSNDRKTKVDEYCIKPKNALFILGTLSPNTGTETNYVPVPSLPANQVVLQGRLPKIMDTMVERALKPRAGVVTMSRQEVVQLSSPHSTTNTGTGNQQDRIAAALTKAGITSPAAWAAAGLADAGAPVMVSVAPGVRPTAAAPDTTENADFHPAAVLKKGTHNPAFFISWRSQKEILNSLGWKSTAMIWGGPVLTLTCVYFLITNFNLL